MNDYTYQPMENLLALIGRGCIPSSYTQTYTRPTSKGNHFIGLRAADIMGPSSVSLTITVQCDNHAPKIDESRTWGYGSLSYSVTLNVHDELMNVSKVEYMIDDSPNAPSAFNLTTRTATITIGGAGTWYLHVRATDEKGNTGIRNEGPFYCN